MMNRSKNEAITLRRLQTRLLQTTLLFEILVFALLHFLRTTSFRVLPHLLVDLFRNELVGSTNENKYNMQQGNIC